MSLFDAKDNKYEEQQPKPVAERTETPVYSNVSVEPVEVAFISSSTKIDGNISTQGNLVVNGTLLGQATANGNIVLNGEVTGDVSCDSVICENARVRSNVIAQNNVVIKKGSVVTGDVTCNNITVYGDVQGNITATGSVVLKASAVVEGNIKAGRIGIESGARISSGSVSVD